METPSRARADRPARFFPQRVLYAEDEGFLTAVLHQLHVAYNHAILLLLLIIQFFNRQPVVVCLIFFLVIFFIFVVKHITQNLPSWPLLNVHFSSVKYIHTAVQ